MGSKNWYELTATSGLISPSLLVYPARIEKNIQTMIAIAGGTERLRPHVKTHKMAEIIHMQRTNGIFKFKCATIAEAELLARCHAEDILLAMQPVGANVDRFFALMAAYPNSTFSTLADHRDSVLALGAKAIEKNVIVSLWLDLNIGMNRTGIAPDESAAALYAMIANHPHLRAMGLHAYDGHLREADPEKRKAQCDAAFETVLALKKTIEQNGIQVTTIVAGGSPTFPFHAKREGIESSPGTTLLWDAGYGTSFPDIPMLAAAVLFTRVVSKPKQGLLCLDLGHKSVASEMSFPRVTILGLENSTQTGQSEEHLVVETPHAEEYALGHEFYALPIHICPTVAKYNRVVTVQEGKATGFWKVAARDHQLEI